MRLAEINKRTTPMVKKVRTTQRIKNAANLIIKTLGATGVTNEDTRRESAKTPTEVLWTGRHPAAQKFWLWLRQFGVEAPIGQVPQFVEGGDGRAYFVDKYVVKFTRDRAGANIANMCIGVPGAPAPVIAVWRVPGETIWAVLQWKVHPEKVSTNIRKAADYLTAWLDDHPDTESFPTELAKQQKLAKSVLSEFNGPIDLVPSMVLVMNAHNKLYFTTGFTHTDGGPTNISMRQTDDDGNEELVYHDLGPNMGADYSPRKILDKVHDNRRKLNLPAVDEI